MKVCYKINLGGNRMSIDNLSDKDLGLNEIASDYEDREKFDRDGDYKPRPSKKPVTEINCALEVALRTSNSVIYVCKSSKQCFNFTALKCCGQADIKIEGEDDWCCDKYGNCILECPDFGTFELKNGGICFMPDECLGEHKKPKSKTLTFKASSCGIKTKFDVTFVFDPCKCCCGCKSCNC